MSDRVSPPQESEGFPTVAANESYVGVMVGPSEHWADLTGDGRKQPTGRIRIMSYENNRKTNQPFEWDDPERFATWFNFVVLEGEYAGVIVGYQVNMKKLIIDQLGQRWSFRFQASTSWLNKLTRLLRESGCQFEDNVVTPWMNEVQTHIDSLDDRPWLWMPVPAPEQMAAIDGLADAEPFPGITRELVLMGLRALLVKKLPIMQFKTRLSETNKVRIVHDSVVALPAGALATYRAMLETEKVKAAVALATFTFREGITAKINGATWGMPGYEQVDDLAREVIPFDEPESDEQGQVKLALKGQINRVATKLGDDFKATAWSIIKHAFDACGVTGQGFQDLPWHAVEATYHEIMEAANHQLKAAALPDALRISVEQFDLCVTQGFDAINLAGYSANPLAKPSDAPPPAL